MKTNDACRILKPLLIGGSLLALVALCGLPLFAQNNLGNIISDSGNISVTDIHSGVNQGMHFGIDGGRGYINWGDFNIQNGQTGNFHFNNGNGVILNRVTGGNATSIYGLLQSNGNVYVINPNGLTIGSTGVVNARGFVGTTFNLDDNNMQRYVNGQTDSLNFYDTGSGAKVLVNDGGTITTIDGDIVLMGSQVEMNGKLEARNGNVTLYAGTGATVHNTPGHPLITVNGNSSLGAVNGNVYALAINNTGTIRANAIEITTAGRILLKGKVFAEQAADGTAGTINVSSGQSIDIENAIITAQGTKTAGNGITIKSVGDTNIKSSVIATTDAGINISGQSIDIEDATISALGTTTTNNGVSIKSVGDTNIKSSVIATTDADIDIEATNGDINFGISADAAPAHLSTLVNAYGTGNVNVTARDITLTADKPHAYISVGSNHGETTVKTTVGDLTLKSIDGGYAQVGYHFRQEDDRIFSWGWENKPESLFSGFDQNNSTDMMQLADLMVPTGNINVDVKNDLVIFASYSADNPDNLQYVQAAHIGHAYLGADKYLGLAITPYDGIISHKHQLSGDTVVTVGRNAKIISHGASIARVGHNVRNFVYQVEPSSIQHIDVNEVRGSIKLTAERDIRIIAKQGGTSGIGHVGDEFHQGATETEPGSGLYYADVYYTTAGRHTILYADGSRELVDGETWHSIAQIGSNIMGTPAEFITGTIGTSGSLEANIVSLSGANVILKGTNGATSVIGHENNSRKPFGNLNGPPARYNYSGVILVGYSFNRFKADKISTETLRHAMDPAMLAYYEKMKQYFTGPEEGYLSVDANSRIGSEYIIPVPANSFKRSIVGIYGFRKMRDGVTDAIRLEHGAKLGAGQIDTSLNPGQYVNSQDQGSNINFLYNIGPYPGDGVDAEYDLEYYGYTYADYLAKNDDVFDYMPFHQAKDDNNIFDFLMFYHFLKTQSNDTLKIFYPSFKKPTTPPDKPPIVPPYERPEKPRYPWFPAWFEPGCIPCKPCCVPCNPCRPSCDPCRTTCYEHYEQSVTPCSAVRTTCEEYLPTDYSSVDESNVTPVPTLAPFPTLAPLE